MSHLRFEIRIKPEDLPRALSIKDVPREFVEMVYPAATDYVHRDDNLQLEVRTPEPIIVEAAISQAWLVLLEEKTLMGPDWSRMWADDTILTEYESLPSTLTSVFSDHTSRDRVVNEAAARMGLFRDAIPPPPPGHPGAVIPIEIGEEADLALMAIRDEVLRASEWQCYLRSVAWEHIPEVYAAVLAETVKHVDLERDKSGVLWGHEDPFNYYDSEDWRHPTGETNLFECADRIREDIWNHATRAVRHIRCTYEDPGYSGVYALDAQKKPQTAPQIEQSAWER